MICYRFCGNDDDYYGHSYNNALESNASIIPITFRSFLHDPEFPYSERLGAGFCYYHGEQDSCTIDTQQYDVQVMIDEK